MISWSFCIDGRTGSAWIVLVLALCPLSCSDTSLANDEPSIILLWDEDRGYPEELAFGDVQTGTYDEATVFVISNDAGDVSLDAIYLELGLDWLVEDGEATSLTQGQSLPVHVRFTPLVSGTWVDTFVVSSSAVEAPIRIPVVAEASGDPVGDIQANPPEMTFGDVDVHTESSAEITLENAGFAPVMVDGITINGTGASGFSLAADPVSGMALGSGANSDAVVVSFAPTQVSDYAATLVITSDDPDEPQLLVPLNGSGWSSAGEGPVAVCGAQPAEVIPPYGESTWVGHESFDPDGHALVNHSWFLLEWPPGSSSTMPECGNSADCGPFAPDMAGVYTGQLQVQNEFGVADTCTAEVTAIPDQILWIELSWTLPADDLDLHLLAPEGELYTSGDCYWATCQWSSLDWGEPGVASDDPSLHTDDISGVGPEILSLPAPTDGVFTVVVVDVTGSNADHPDQDPVGDNLTTINVYLDGHLALTETRPISGEGTQETFCTIELPSGAVTSVESQ